VVVSAAHAAPDGFAFAFHVHSHVTSVSFEDLKAAGEKASGFHIAQVSLVLAVMAF
jgi:hypothetical protein